MEEESPQNLSLKISGDLDHPGEPKAAENPDVPLKRQCRDSLACRHSNLDSDGETAAQETLEMYREKPSYVASGRGLQEQPSVPVLKFPPVWLSGMCSFAHIEPSPNKAKSKSALAW